MTLVRVQWCCDFLFLSSAVRLLNNIHEVIGIHHLAVLTKTLLAQDSMNSQHALVLKWYAVRMLHCLSPAQPLVMTACWFILN